MGSPVFVDLKLNRTLINPNFGGYKLSLDPLPVYRTALETGIDVVKLSDDLYSYQHLKAFGIHNHLFLDPWNDNAVYFVNTKWGVMKAVMEGLAFRAPSEQFTIPEAANRRLIPNRLNVSIHFISPNLVVLSDGTDKLYVMHSGDRKNDTPWKIAYSGQPLGEDDKHFIVLNAVLRTCDLACYVEILLIHVDSNPLAASEDSEPSFITKLEWITLHSDNASSYDLVRTRRLEGLTCPEYVSVLPNGSALLLIAEKQFKFTFDSVQPLDGAPESTSDEAQDSSEPAYTWAQTNEDVTVCFRVPDNITKNDIICEFHSDRLAVTLKDDSLLTGNLSERINVDASTWTINDEHVLEVHLTKSESGNWSNLVLGDSRGKMILSAEQLEIINEQLEKFTSETENADPQEGKKVPFNAQQLEDCDMFPDDSSAIWCLNGETHRVVQQVNISSNQWLFNAVTSTEDLPVVCLRHDVDGVVWQPILSSGDSSDDIGKSLSWQHVGTFDAFGYVQASKQQRKFATCPPDMSYVAIGDCVRHIYIYRRPTSISSPIRNRRTGETVSAVSRQQLISLESVEDIMGLRASNTDIYALSGNTLYAVRVNDWTE